MSVVNLLGRTTTAENDFTDNKSSQASLLFVKNEKSVERFSLDLTVGDAWAKNYSPTQKLFVRIDSDGIRVGRHDSVVVEVAEEIRVPNNMYGVLIPTGSMFLGLGILIAPAKIEPGFTGKLKLRLFNTTADKHTIKAGTKLGSAIFFATETTVSHPTISRDMQISDVKATHRSRLCAWIKSNPPIWISWLVSLVGGSLMGAIVSAYLLSGVKMNDTSRGAGVGAIVVPPITPASATKP